MKEQMKKQIKNKDFVQLYRGTIGPIINLAETNVTAFKLFMIIIGHMDGYNALCISNIALQELMGCSKNTVIRTIKYLREQGWIFVHKVGTSNVYVTNPELVWTSYSTQKAYCKFPANVMLTPTENSDYLNNPKAVNRFKQIDSDYIKECAKNKEYMEKLGEQINANL